MLIDCPFCKSRVDAKEHGHREWSTPDDPYPSRIVVAECPSCGNTLVGEHQKFDHPEYGEVWTDSTRLWPYPKKRIPRNVPNIVKLSLEEADICFSAGALSACAVMCGRSLEGICAHFKVKVTLASGLQALLDQEIIDKRLFQWGDELRKVRNLGAHATNQKITAEDARDVLDFAHAITEYVFVLNEQFERFMKRKEIRPTIS